MAEQEEKTLLNEDESIKYGLSNVGDVDIRVLNGDGESIDFENVYSSKPKTIIVFLRHFL